MTPNAMALAIAPPSPRVYIAPWRKPMRPTHPIIRWKSGHIVNQTDELTEEEPVEIRVRGRAVSVAMRTRGGDRSKAWSRFTGMGSPVVG
jgi:hypothetical protein